MEAVEDTNMLEIEKPADMADWVGKKCGNFNTKTNKCGS